MGAWLTALHGAVSSASKHSDTCLASIWQVLRYCTCLTALLWYLDELRGLARHWQSHGIREGHLAGFILSTAYAALQMPNEVSLETGEADLASRDPAAGVQTMRNTRNIAVHTRHTLPACKLVELAS